MRRGTTQQVNQHASASTSLGVLVLWSRCLWKQHLVGPHRPLLVGQSCRMMIVSNEVRGIIEDTTVRRCLGG